MCGHFLLQGAGNLVSSCYHELATLALLTFIIIYLGTSSVWPLLATRSWKPCHHIDDHPQEVDGKQDVELEVQVCEAGQIFLVT